MLIFYFVQIEKNFKMIKQIFLKEKYKKDFYTCRFNLLSYMGSEIMPTNQWNRAGVHRYIDLLTVSKITLGQNHDTL